MGTRMADREECRLCRAEISTELRECPECGYNPRRTLLLVGGAVFLLGVALSGIVGTFGVAVVIIGALFVGSGLFYAKPTR